MKNDWSEDRVPALKRGMVCVEQSDGTIAILPDGVTEHFFVLEGISAELFKLINGRRTIGKIAEQISTKHNISLENVMEESAELFDQLVENKILD